MRPDSQRGRLPWAATLTLALACAANSASAADPNYYVVTDIGGLAAGGSTKAYGLNNYGQVVGNAPDDTGEEKPKCWHWQNGEIVDINATIHFRNLFTLETGEAYDVSDADQIVGGGWYELKVEWREEPLEVIQAFVTRPAVLSDFGTPYPGDAVTVLGAFTVPTNSFFELNSVATAISNNNHVVGWANITDGDVVPDPNLPFDPNWVGVDEYHYHNNFHAFIVRPSADGDGWFKQGQLIHADGTDGIGNTLMVDLGVLRGIDQISAASDVNDDGLVVGYSYGDEVGYRAFAIDPVADQWEDQDGNVVNTMMVDLGTLGGTNSWARGVNNLGQIVGDADAATFDTHAFVVTPRVETDDDGQIINTIYYEDRLPVATADVDGDGDIDEDDDGDGVNDLMTDLGTLGGANSAALAINDDGVIVGWSENANREKRACIWIDGEIFDLNSLVILTKQWKLTEARDINAAAQIVGWGSYAGNTGGGLRGYRLDLATPEEIAQLPPTDADGADPSDPNSPNTSVTGNLDLPPVLADSSGDQTSTADQSPVPTPGALCGMGLAQMLPLLLLGIFGIKARYRR